MFKISKLALLLSAGLLGTNLYAASSVEFVPGKYIGEANGRNGPMKVEVTVNQNKITNIQVLSHRESAGLSDAPLTQLPKEIIERQNIYDGTWQKTPSMGFMFVPLPQYPGGGAAATIEPLNEHLSHYETRLRNLFGAGVQACYRGPRLYDTEQTRKLVTQWVAFYKQYRQILDSDIIHLRRPDGQDWDGIMHVNPQSKRKAFISVYNPLDIAIEREIEVPLYYTGLTNKAIVKEQDKNGKEYSLARNYSILLKIRIPAKGYNWYIIE